MPTKQEQLNAIMKRTAEQYEKVNSRLQDFAIKEIDRNKKELNDLLMGYSSKEGTVDKYRLRRLINDLETIEKAYYDNGMQAMTEVVRQSAEHNIMGSGVALGTAVNAGINEAHFNRLSMETVRYTINRFGEDGLVLSDRIWKLAKEQRADLEQVIRSGIIRGESVNTLVAKVRKVYDNDSWKIRRLVITEGNVAYRTAGNYVAQQSKHVQGVRIHRGEADRPEHRCTQLEKEDRYGFGKGVFLPTDTEILNPHVNCTSYTTYVLFDDVANEEAERKRPVKPKQEADFVPTDTKLYRDMKDELYKGTRLGDLTDLTDFDDLYEQLDEGNLINPAYFYAWRDKGVQDIFGEDMTLEGIANVFNPDPSRFNMRYTRFNIGDSEAKLGFQILTKNGDHVGSINRSIILHEGKYYVKNDLLEIANKYQGQDFATNIYFKQEQFYKLLAGDSEVTIGTLANLDVGVYAWTRHGFDFQDADDAIALRRTLERHIDNKLKEGIRAGKYGAVTDELKDKWRNGLREKSFKEELNKFGYNDLNEIKHSWQFASLDDGNQYDLIGGSNVSGKGHFGKYLMLDYTSWKGVKRLNVGHDTEAIGNLYYARKGIQ